MKVFELNLDGLVGPTHHYAGLSAGNVASTTNAHKPANPQAAALQGIAKMRFMHRLGLKQGVLPPHQRPNLKLLEQLGFSGTPAQQVQSAFNAAPELLSAAYSASSMWTANAATITPSIDAMDGLLHLTPANLVSNLHRHQEAGFSHILLNTIFNNERYFKVHEPLPFSAVTGDEGAANHNRLCQQHNTSGVHLFVYGRQALSAPADSPYPKRYPARQTLEASKIIARNHAIAPHRAIFAAQNPDAIDQGVFHNDVISVANESVYLVHEKAFFKQREVLQALRAAVDFDLNIIEIPESALSIEDAVSSYLFNSQLISRPDNGGMMLIAPTECETNLKVAQCIEGIIADSANPIRSVHYFDLKQSMRNGGGPACLRLRVPVNEAELDALHQGIIVDETLLEQLETWVKKHYRTQLLMEDLANPGFITEVHTALDELSKLLQLGSIYPFQRA